MLYFGFSLLFATIFTINLWAMFIAVQNDDVYFRYYFSLPTTSTLPSKPGVMHMNRTHQRGRGFAIFFLWTFVGTILGMGVAYFVYARQTPLFESVAILKVVREEIDANVVEADSGELPLQLAVADEDPNDGADQVAAFRITDDASQDVVLSEQTEPLAPTEPREKDAVRDGSVGSNAGTPSESKPAQSSLRGKLADDSLLLCSQAVLERAVELGELNGVQELQWMVSVRDQSPEAFVRTWVNSGSLRVEKSGETSLGGVYEIAFRSRLPSTSQRVVQAVAASAIEKFDNGGRQKQHAKALELLTSGRAELDTTLRDLQTRLSEFPSVNDAMLRDGDVVSSDAVRLNAAVDRFERLQRRREGLKQNLRRAEALLAEGADRRLVLDALGTLSQVKLASQSPATDADLTQIRDSESSKAAEEYRSWLEMRNDLIEKVEREVAPMEKKLDALIEKKYGPNHPAVSHLRGQIGRVRAQLANLPPEPDSLGSVAPGTRAGFQGSPAATQGSPVANQGNAESRDRADGISMVALLKAMRSELSVVSEDLERLDPELETLSTMVAAQAKALRQRESIELEIEQQQSMRNAMIEQLKSMNQGRSSPEISCALLVPAGAGVQVAPELQSHLLAGGFLGGASGAVLFLLIVLSVTAVGADSEPDS